MVSLAQEIATIEDDIKRLVDEKHTSEVCLSLVLYAWVA